MYFIKLLTANAAALVGASSVSGWPHVLGVKQMLLSSEYGEDKSVKIWKASVQLAEWTPDLLVTAVRKMNWAVNLKQQKMKQIVKETLWCQMHRNEHARRPRTENKPVLRYNLLVWNEAVNWVWTRPFQEHFQAAISLIAHLKLHLSLIDWNEFAEDVSSFFFFFYVEEKVFCSVFVYLCEYGFRNLSTGKEFITSEFLNNSFGLQALFLVLHILCFL